MKDVEFRLAGAELTWPFGLSAGPTNHPDIEMVANNFDFYTSLGMGIAALGGWKLGGPDGGNGYVQNDAGRWEHVKVDEYVDPVLRAGHNAKGLPGPGTDIGMLHLDDFLDLAWSRDVEVTLNLSPHTKEPLEEIKELYEVARKGLEKGVLVVEFNLSCPNLEGRPPFYQDYESLERLMAYLDDQDPLLNRYGKLGLYLKYGPYNSAEDLHKRPQLAANVGGIITSNTLGGQEPKTPEGKPAVEVNGGKAGMSGPVLNDLGRHQLNWSLENQPIEHISVLGVDSGYEVKRRLDMGASAVQMASVLYWPEGLGGADTAGEVVERIKSEFIDAMAA